MTFETVPVPSIESNVQAMTNNRKYERTEPSKPLDAHAQLSEYSLVTGEVLDYGVGGVFFKPDMGYVDGGFVEDGDLDVGDIVEIYVAGLIRVLARVAWAGYHPKHKCFGYGMDWKQLD